MSESIGILREAWGPRFWQVYHTMAECSGFFTDIISSQDEGEIWIQLLKLQANIMPCKICQEHYLEWLLSHMVERVRYLKGEERRRWLRHWLWSCHEAINRMNKKSTPNEEDLPSLFPKRSVQKEIVELGTMFTSAMEKRLINVEDVLRWRQLMTRLRNLYGV